MYLRLFGVVTLVGLLILPVINVATQNIELKDILRISRIYNTDIVESYTNKFLVNYELSTQPDKTLVGKNGWYFLGDGYFDIVSKFRNGSDAEDIIEATRKVITSQESWRNYYKDHNVADFKILVGPNKSTIYPEYLPVWAKSESESISDGLYKSKDIYVDSRLSLKKAKSNFPLYYRSDTHWNFYGAGIVFYNFINVININNNIIIPPQEWGEVVENKIISGGDLARFLKVEKFIEDREPVTAINNINLEHVVYDFNTKSEVYRGLSPRYGSMNDLLLIETPQALNNKKVLWLSDSFGNALSPYMTATFSHIVKQHWENLAGTKKLEEIIERWQPDFVFITVVERVSLNEEFMKMPAIQYIKDVSSDFNFDINNAVLHDLIRKNNSRYEVTAGDPFLVYEIESAGNKRSIKSLNFRLSCIGNVENVPVKIFWRTKNTYFNEVDSAEVVVSNDFNQLSIPMLASVQDIQSIRIDIESYNNCKQFYLTNAGVDFTSELK